MAQVHEVAICQSAFYVGPNGADMRAQFSPHVQSIIDSLTPPAPSAKWSDFRYTRNGAMRFIRVGKIQSSWCIARKPAEKLISRVRRGGITFIRVCSVQASFCATQKPVAR